MNTIAGRLVLMFLLIHAVLMPVLFFAIDAVVVRYATNTFLDDARIYSRMIADSIENLGPAASDEEIIQHLDSAILAGNSVFAVFREPRAMYSSTLIGGTEIDAFNEDFEFGQHGDDIYYLSVPASRNGGNAILQLGFDETPTRDNLHAVRLTIIGVLAVYSLFALLATGYLSSTVFRPLRRLQYASRTISSGDVDRELKAETDIAEIRDLSGDLETMRSKLVGMNARLQKEIAEREQAEEERRSLERRLRHAQRLESLGTLAGGVAHEFNNVLQPILLYTGLAMDDVPTNSVTAQNLERVAGLAKRAKGLSQQILTFGRQDAGAEFETRELAPIVEEALTMIRALLPATIDLRADIGYDIGCVRCDPSQIRQLIVNLCNNASQALAGTDGYVEVSLHEVIVPRKLADKHPNLRPGDYAVLQVTDTGRGMEPDVLERAFEPFFTTREVGEGTGLGLSVVHGIVTAHGGEIILESEPGKGTRFRIYLPLSTEGAQELIETRDRDG